MTHAYSGSYLSDAKDRLSQFFDYLINDCGMKADWIASIFLSSGYAEQFERGNPAILAGMSGIELARAVVEATYKKKKLPEPRYSEGLSPEYWAGWSLAYYQWLRNYHFMHILNAVPLSKIIKMYSIYHEMDISQFVDRLDEILKSFYPQTALRRYREIAGLSQSELASMSGVPLRQIQLFEQRQRDIKKAQSQAVLMLSKALECSMEDLIND